MCYLFFCAFSTIRSFLRSWDCGFRRAAICYKDSTPTELGFVASVGLCFFYNNVTPTEFHKLTNENLQFRNPAPETQHPLPGTL